MTVGDHSEEEVAMLLSKERDALKINISILSGKRGQQVIVKYFALLDDLSDPAWGDFREATTEAGRPVREQFFFFKALCKYCAL